MKKGKVAKPTREFKTKLDWQFILPKTGTTQKNGGILPNENMWSLFS